MNTEAATKPATRSKSAELHNLQQSIAAAVNAELGGTVLCRKPPQTKHYSGTAPNGDRVRAVVEYGDDCGNGHNTFSITGNVWYADADKYERSPRDRKERAREGDACGCVHEDIARAIPELVPLLKWHLASTDGPWGYFANAVFLAGDADCWGRRAGEVASTRNGVRFGTSPVTHVLGSGFGSSGGDAFVTWLKARTDAEGRGVFAVVEVPHGPDPGGHKFQPKYTFAQDSEQFGQKWHECPFDGLDEANEWALALATLGAQFVTIPTSYSEGKARELDNARSAAVWPEATDAELSVPRDDLVRALAVRLPALMREFHAAVVALGFRY